MTRRTCKLEIQTCRSSAASILSRGWTAGAGRRGDLLAPVAEELLFRGILYPAIKQAGFPRLALWGTSLLFAAMHMNLVTFVPLLCWRWC